VKLFSRRCHGNSSSQTKLELGLGCSVELLVDGWIGAVEGDVGACGVGESIEDDIGLGWNCKEEAKLFVRLA
jgi:hypothetical protein